MIVVTGATGVLAGTTVDYLLERAVSAGEIVVVARDVAKARRFADLGITVRHGDYADPASLPAAFDGADQLLLVSASDPTADAVSLHRAAIDAAVTAKVGRILYTSHQGAAPNTPFGPGRDHHHTEQILAETGIPWTSLRNGFYLHSLAWLLGPWQQTGRISVPAEGPVSWTERRDAGEAAAVILASNPTHDGPVTLTASAAPTFTEIAGIASELTGRTIQCEVLSEEEWLAAQITAGQPEFMARFLLGLYQAAERGFFAGTAPLLGELLGREPKTVRDLLSEPASA